MEVRFDSLGSAVQISQPKFQLRKRDTQNLFNENDWVKGTWANYLGRAELGLEKEVQLLQALKNYGIEYAPLGAPKYSFDKGVLETLNGLQKMSSKIQTRIGDLEKITFEAEDRIYRKTLFGEAGIREVKTAPGKAKRYELAKDIYKVLEAGEEISTYDMRAKTGTLDRRISSFYSSLFRLEQQGLVEEVEKKSGRWPWSKRYNVYKLTEVGKQRLQEIKQEQEKIGTYINEVATAYKEHFPDLRGGLGELARMNSVYSSGGVDFKTFDNVLSNLKARYMNQLPSAEGMGRLAASNG